MQPKKSIVVIINIFFLKNSCIHLTFLLCMMFWLVNYIALDDVFTERGGSFQEEEAGKKELDHHQTICNITFRALFRLNG